MSDYFDATWNNEDRVLEIRLTGFWPEDEMGKYEAHLASIVAYAAGQPFDVVAHFVDLVPQSGAVATLQSRLISRLVGSGMRKLIVVGASALVTMQVKRAAANAITPLFVTDTLAARQILQQDESVVKMPNVK